MKKFCFCLISLVFLLFVGITTYYIVRNNETIAYTVSNKDTLYMNIGETMDAPIIHKNKASGTTINVSLSNENVDFDEVNNKITALKTGSTTITCVPSNANFSAISFTICVGDGSNINPYYIRNEEDLNKIGRGDWRLSSSYQLVSDIVLTKPFNSIGDYNSPFTGSLFGGEAMYSISNIIISSDDSTAGFFGNIGANAKVERISFKNISINGRYAYAGGIAGINSGFIGQCNIENLKIINTNTKGITGGIAGLNKSQGASAQISLCMANVDIDGDGLVGGFVGRNEGGTIDNSKVDVDVKLNNSKSVYGGIVGENIFASSSIGSSQKYSNSRFINLVSTLNRIGNYGKYYTAIGSSSADRSQPSTLSYYEMIMVCASNSLLVHGDLGEDKVLSNNSQTAVGFYANIKPEELTSDIVFKSKSGSNWDFENFWSCENDSLIHINFEASAGSYPELPATSSIKAEISSANELINALALMREYPSVNLEYTIPSSADITVDYQGATISPIGSKDSPFFGKLIAEEGAYVLITNYTISKSEYSGFFGVIQGSDTIIQNISFSEGRYTGKTIGGIVGFNNGGKILDCNIGSFYFDITGVAGGIVGENKGTIYSCGVNTDSGYCEVFINEIENAEANIGCVAGVNDGNISLIQISGLTIEAFSESDKPVNLGGFVGKQISGSLVDCKSYNFIVKLDRLKGNIYAGGFIGYMNKGSMKDCSVVNGLSINLPTSRDGVVTGGLVGFEGSDCLIETSVVYLAEITSRLAGGIVGVQFGRVEKTAAMEGVELIGANVGGLVGDCNGILRNSYSLASLVGSNYEAGFVVFLNSGASVKYCYNYCAYTGSGKGYCETSTAFRSNGNNREFINNIVVGEKIGGDKLLVGDMFMTKVKQRPLNQSNDESKPSDGNQEEKPSDENKQEVNKPQVSAKEVYIQTNAGYSKGSFKIVSESVLMGNGAFADFLSAGFNSYVWDFSTDFANIEKKLFENIVDNLNSQINALAYKKPIVAPQQDATKEGEEQQPQPVDPVSVALGYIKKSTNDTINHYLSLKKLPKEEDVAYTLKLNLSIEDFINNELSQALNEGNELGILLGIDSQEKLEEVQKKIKDGIQSIIQDCLNKAIDNVIGERFLNTYNDDELKELLKIKNDEELDKIKESIINGNPDDKVKSVIKTYANKTMVVTKDSSIENKIAYSESGYSANIEITIPELVYIDADDKA